MSYVPTYLNPTYLLSTKITYLSTYVPIYILHK